MPAKNSNKQFSENAYYHIYNRGVEKRQIFLDEQDYKIFLFYLKIYLLPTEELLRLAITSSRIYRFLPLNLSKEVDLLSFALMPNHFHLLIQQHTIDGMTKFMRRLSTSYVMYFNQKYSRVGTLFQGRYKAISVEKDEYLLHLSRYIHLNPVNVIKTLSIPEYTSYPYYLGNLHASWIKPKQILAYFQNSKKDQEEYIAYKDFVESYNNSTELLGELILEDE